MQDICILWHDKQHVLLVSFYRPDQHKGSNQNLNPVLLLLYHLVLSISNVFADNNNAIQERKQNN